MQDEKLGDSDFVNRSFINCVFVNSEFARAIETDVIHGFTET